MQRQRLDNLKESQHSAGAAADYSQAAGGAARSKASGAHGGPSSSSNLEKAYDDLAREIEEIKAKLQNSITINDEDPRASHGVSPNKRSSKQSLSKGQMLSTHDRLGNSSKNTQYMRGSGHGGYTSLRGHKGLSAKSIGRRSGGRADSRSPDRPGTQGRSGADGNLDDPDYSLSVSELNSNLGNSLLKSNSRRPDYQAMMNPGVYGNSGGHRLRDHPVFNDEEE